MNGVTSKSLTSAAILTGCAVASKLRIGPTPLLPFKHADQKWSLPTPLGATMPRPVTTTLRIPAYLTEQTPPRQRGASRVANSAVLAGLEDGTMQSFLPSSSRPFDRRKFSILSR